MKGGHNLGFPPVKGVHSQRSPVKGVHCQMFLIKVAFSWTRVYILSRESIDRGSIFQGFYLKDCTSLVHFFIFFFLIDRPKTTKKRGHFELKKQL